MTSPTTPSQPTEADAPHEEAPEHAQARGYVRVRQLIGRAIGSFSRFGDLDTLYDPRERDILDYGWAGDGDRAVALIRRGARMVTGFDLWWTQEGLERVEGLMRDAGVEK
jgi:hypothetical protein